MKKGGIAIEQILYIFLMVIVILVASTFLLKALGIDIFGWISEMFAPFLKPKQGKVLHIKIDPGDTPVEIWEFHLVNLPKEADCKRDYARTSCYKHLQEQDKNPLGGQDTTTWFIINSTSYERSFCIIFTTDEQWWYGKFDRPDLAWVYYIKPGAKIQDGCGNNLKDCIQGYIEEEGCEPKQDIPDCKEAGAYNIVECYDKLAPGPYCDSDKNVEKQNFVVTTEARFKPCKDNPANCNLLFENSYIIKYGIICDEKGIWQPCTEEIAKKLGAVDVGGKVYQCKCEAETCFWIEMNHV